MSEKTYNICKEWLSIKKDVYRYVNKDMQQSSKYKQVWTQITEFIGKLFDDENRSTAIAPEELEFIRQNFLAIIVVLVNRHWLKCRVGSGGGGDSYLPIHLISVLYYPLIHNNSIPMHLERNIREHLSFNTREKDKGYDTKCLIRANQDDLHEYEVHIGMIGDIRIEDELQNDEGTIAGEIDFSTKNTNSESTMINPKYTNAKQTHKFVRIRWFDLRTKVENYLYNAEIKPARVLIAKPDWDKDLDIKIRIIDTKIVFSPNKQQQFLANGISIDRMIISEQEKTVDVFEHSEKIATMTMVVVYE